jgi:peptide/nickel transport system substrate-binding protein
MVQTPELIRLLVDSTPMSRRDILKRGAAIGLALPIAGTLLAACGDDDDDDIDDPAVDPDADPDDDDDDEPAVDPDDDDDDEPEDDDDTTPDDDDRYGGLMVLTGHQEMVGLHPDDDNGWVMWVVITQIHNAVVEIDEHFELEPALAEDYDISEDGLTYTFYLREGVLFHDGHEFTAEDVKFTYEWFMDPDNAAVRALRFRDIDTVEVEDDYTVVVNMDGVNAAFIRQGAIDFIVPAHYHGEVGKDVYTTAPIGTGPFKVVDWRPTDFTLLEAFDDHFRGRPYLDELRMDIIPETSVRAVALETGEADSNVWALSREDELRLLDDPNFRTFETVVTHVNHIPLNNDKPQLSEKDVRQAMMYAIDRQRIIDDIFLGAATLATSNISPAVAYWYEPDVKEYPYDPDQAVALLDEAGWEVGADGVREKDGIRLAFTINPYSGDEVRRSAAELVQSMLAEVGIEVSIAEMPIAAVSEGMRSGELDAGIWNTTYGGTNGEPDAPNLHSTSPVNSSKFRNARVDELLELGLRETDEEARRPYYSEIQQIVAEEVPFLYLMYWDWFNHFSDRIQGLPDGDVLEGVKLYRKCYQFWIEE